MAWVINAQIDPDKANVGSANAVFTPVVAILDPGQLVSVVNGSLTISCPTGGLIQFTGGG